jgi:quercetin dioxygenase-like cupin family protein
VKHHCRCSPAVRVLVSQFFVSVITASHWVSVHAESLPDPLAAGWQGRQVCEKLHESNDIRVLRCTFAPGVGHERHFHDAHYGYALSGGTMKITDGSGTRTVELQTGSDFYSDGVDWHTVINVGETTVQYLIVEPLS